MSHIDHLLALTPLLSEGKILDVGAGKGDFILSAAQKGLDVVGLEYNPDYIKEAKKKADTEHLNVVLVQGEGEHLPFEDNMFTFVNLSEVIEHVQNPRLVLSEVYRVLQPGGSAYVSAPNRFGVRDSHFHLYFINWLPREWAHLVIGFLGKHKSYSREAGLQRIDEMHYYTFSQFRRLLEAYGFMVVDIREERIRREVPPVARLGVLLSYRVLRPFWFDTAHVLATKLNEPIESI